MTPDFIMGSAQQNASNEIFKSFLSHQLWVDRTLPISTIFDKSLRHFYCGGGNQYCKNQGMKKSRVYSRVKSLMYDPFQKIVIAEFRNGLVLTFFNVDSETWGKLLKVKIKYLIVRAIIKKNDAFPNNRSSI